MLSNFFAVDSSTAPDTSTTYTSLQSRLLSLLYETSEKCEKNSMNVENQERYAMIAVVPRVVENRAKAKVAFKKVFDALNKARTEDELIAFLGSPLIKEEGLFFRIFRGKINKHLVPAFDAEVQTKIRYHK